MPITSYENWRKQQELDASSKPVRGVVSTYVPERELLKCEMFGSSGQAELTVRQPFLAVNSWIRVGPESGTSVISQRRGDVDQSEVWGYLSHTSANLIKQAKTNKKIAYRVIQDGEIEVMSRGMASAYFSNAGDLELWGGTLSEIISQTELEHCSNAPTFSRRLAKNQWSVIGNEERFGLVKRPSKLYPEMQQEYVRLADNSFACEYSRWISDTANNVLATLQEGHVIDENQNIKKQSSTNKNLRYERTFLTSDGASTLLAQIDEDLNFYLDNSNANQIEAKLQWGQLCDVTTTCNKFKMQLQDTGQITTGTSLIFGASSAIQIGAPSVTFGPSTSAAASAAQPVVLGTALVSQILTPLLTALITWFTTFAAEPQAVLLLPASKVGATAASTTLTTTAAQLSNVLSQVVKLSQ